MPIQSNDLAPEFSATLRRRLDDHIAEPWTNPGRTPSEMAFFARKRAEFEAQQGRGHQEGTNRLLGFEPVASPLPNQRAPRRNTPRPRRGYRHRRDNQFYRDGDHRRKLHPDQIHKIMFFAEAEENRTKAKGRENGVYGLTGLKVLRALLKGFYNYRTGQCDPSYDAIQKATKLCRQTIADTIRRLEASGLMQVVRRLIRVVVPVRCPVTGRVTQELVVQQTSNAYLFNPPEEGKPPQFWEEKAESAAQRESSSFVYLREQNRTDCEDREQKQHGMPPKGAT